MNSAAQAGGVGAEGAGDVLGPWDYFGAGVGDFTQAAGEAFQRRRLVAGHVWFREVF